VESNNELGPQLAFYRNKAWPYRLLYKLILPGLLFVLAPLAYGLYRANSDYTQFGPAAIERWIRPWIFLTLSTSILFLLILLYWQNHNLRSVVLHENGLTLALPRRLTLHWELICGISSETVSERFFGVPIRARQRAILYLTSGKNIRLDGLENLAELVNQIKAHLYPRLLPELERGLISGQWLHFGKVAIHSDALRLRGRQLPWSQICSLSVQSGDLVVEFTNQAVLCQPAGTIPNLELLLKICQRINV
jgi:hypothetical protein